MKHLLLVPLMLLAACSVNTTPELKAGPDGTITILKDTGGNPYEYAALYDQLKASGQRVRLGECNSACTMLMTLPNACLIPGKRFGFHASNLNGRFDGFVAQYYRAGVKRAFVSEWSKSREMTKLVSEEMIKLDSQLKLCRK